MKCAYVTTYDPLDVLNWSGLGHYIYKALKWQEWDVECIGPLPQYFNVRRHWLKAKHLFYNRLFLGRFGDFSAERDHTIAEFYAKAVMERLRGKRHDVIVCPGSIPVAFLKTDVPIVIWSDATFNSLATTYPNYTNRTKGYYKDGERLEQAAYKTATLCVFSSEWAAKSAVEYYGLNAQKVKVIPFGANVEDDSEISGKDVEAAAVSRSPKKVRLLFAGVDFKRKGGDKVLEVLRELIRLPVPAELHIIGCTPEIPSTLQRHVEVHGFVSKRTEEGRQKVAQAFLSAHWLILLPVAECAAVVFAEASRYGVPCVSNRVGGISTIIRDESHGKLFPANATPAEIAQYIASVSLNTDRYIKMAVGAYREYQERLNWRVAGRAFAACVHELLSGSGK